MVRILLLLPNAGGALSWARAFAVSFVAVLLLAAGTGVVFLPAEISSLKRESNLYVDSVQRWKGQQVVFLVRELSKQIAGGLRCRVVIHDFASDKTREISTIANSQPTCITVDAKEERLFISNEAGSIYRVDLRDIEAGAGLIGRHVRGVAHTFAYSEDGKTLISVDNHDHYAWNLETWTPRWCRLDDSPTCLAISPDSRSMICDRPQGDRRQLVEVDLYTGETSRIVADDAFSWRFLAASPDGRLLIGIDPQGAMVQLRRSTGDDSWQMQPISDMPCGLINTSPSMSPDSKILLTIHRDGGRLAFWDAQREAFQFELVGTPHSMHGAEFLDEDTFVTWDADGAIQLWDLHQRSVVRRGTLPRHHPAS